MDSPRVLYNTCTQHVDIRTLVMCVNMCILSYRSMECIIFYFTLNMYVLRCVTPSQWEGFSNQNILKTEKERNASCTLRGVNRGVLDQTQQDVLRLREVVNHSFDQRIKETLEAKQNLEHHLDQVR